MLARIEGNGVRIVLVETASRFARDILVQETGWRFLKERGIDLIAVDSPAAFLDDTPTSKLVRQLLGVISEFEEGLDGRQARRRRAGARKRIATGAKVEGPQEPPRRRGPRWWRSPRRWRASGGGASG